MIYDYVRRERLEAGKVYKAITLRNCVVDELETLKNILDFPVSKWDIAPLARIVGASIERYRKVQGVIIEALKYAHASVKGDFAEADILEAFTCCRELQRMRHKKGGAPINVEVCEVEFTERGDCSIRVVGSSNEKLIVLQPHELNKEIVEALIGELSNKVTRLMLQHDVPMDAVMCNLENAYKK